MARASLETMRDIIEFPPETTPNVAPFIDAAHELVEELCLESDYTERRLTMIETWLAAHFYTMLDPRVEVESAGSVRAEYQSKIDYGLKLSHYGQTALRLDTRGNLAALDNSMEEIKGLPGVSAHTSWLGRTPAKW